MAKWELAEVDKDECDICGAWTTINCYKRPITCQCNKCQDHRLSKYEYFNVCGNCFTEWAKSNAQFEEIDYGN